MNKPLDELLADANQSASIMELVASFEPEDIEGDDVDLRFELDGVDTGANVSLVGQCGKASDIIKALIAALEQSQAQSSKWLEAYHKAVSIGARYEERIAEFEASQLAVNLPSYMTPKMMREVQMHSELGSYAAGNLAGAYDLFQEFWGVAIRAAGGDILSLAINDVIAERNRQVNAEGWTPEHDDNYHESELSDAAACYALHAHNQGFPTPAHWPWDYDWWKQTNPRRDLVKAGALILAEIERIDRAAGGSVKSEGNNG